MITFTDAQLLKWLVTWWWPFLRITGFVMAAPFIGTRTVPARARMMIAIGIAVVLAPVISVTTTIAPASAEGLFVAAQQVFIGVLLGLTLRFLLLALELAGQVIAMQMGLGFAAMVDPQTGAQVPVVSQTYILLATLLFFASNGHLLLVSLIADSFALLPVGTSGISRAGLADVMLWSGQVFAQALIIALPMVVALLIVNVAVGVMGRASPQLNIFAVGFPVMILFGMGMILTLLDTLPSQVNNILRGAIQAAQQLLSTR